MDTVATEAMVNGESVVEYSKDGMVPDEIRRIWNRIDAIAKET